MRYAIDQLAASPHYHAAMRSGRISACRRFVDVDAPMGGLTNVEPAQVAAGWPTWATALRALRRDGERGVGDTAERLFGSFGGQPFKMALRSAGIECGCDERKEKWNEVYHY